MDRISILKANNLNKTFLLPDKEIHILKDISFEVFKGETVSIVGPSGSGKTTLLGICAGLDTPSNGELLLLEQNIKSLKEEQRTKLRNQSVGFIFQNFQLLNNLTALENVLIPLELKDSPNKIEKATELLKRVGLEGRIDHYPTQLSGGEQQRVAIARAFANEPKILFADEPTGNLDEETSDKVEKLLFELNKDQNTTLIIITHDRTLAAKTDRILEIKGGKISEITQHEVA